MTERETEMYKTGLTPPTGDSKFCTVFDFPITVHQVHSLPLSRNGGLLWKSDYELERKSLPGYFAHQFESFFYKFYTPLIEVSIKLFQRFIHNGFHVWDLSKKEKENVTLCHYDQIHSS